MLANPRVWYCKAHCQIEYLVGVCAGQEDMEDGGATNNHCHLCEPEHAAAPGLPLHPYQLLH